MSSSHILQAAHQLCRQRGVRLTPLRQQVFELILQQQKPIGAYSLLEQLASAQGRHAAPPTVYRALNFLLEQGLIHKITSLNAFTACFQPSAPHIGQFLICDYCGDIAEFDAPQVNASLHQQAQQFGFRIEKQIIEITGCCAECQQGCS
ncbi:MAG: Fur family transcriptional regulator [Pseudomonadota bacterium]|nr:Fur family transcriptional regulator [Pseudomonadota bacterium]